jgi:hypothetical protein
MKKSVPASTLSKQKRQTKVSNMKTSRTLVTPRRTPSVAKSMKRYGKKSLRSILLSHTFHTGFRVIVIATLILVPFYGAYAYIGKTVANEIVISKSQILERVAKHMTLPAGKPEAVVRVQDADNLKKQNPFYDQIQPGNYILMYKTEAIIYDLQNDKIVAVKQI